MVLINKNDLSPIIFLFTLLTTLFLQILSNLANDLGDFQKGTDDENRIGPKRSIQSGEITASSMKKAVFLFVLLSFSSGVILLYFSFRNASLQQALFFLGLGIAGILAAISYTVGKRAYGYHGLGDLFVLLFFGFTGVLGSAYLHNHEWKLSWILPALTIGFWSTGVLNLNNMRDHLNDEQKGKRTLVVQMGYSNARIYHSFLLLCGLLTFILFLLTESANNPWFLLLTMPSVGIIINLRKVFSASQPIELDPGLKQLAITTFLFSLTFLMITFFGS